MSEFVDGAPERAAERLAEAVAAHKAAVAARAAAQEAALRAQEAATRAAARVREVVQAAEQAGYTPEAWRTLLGGKETEVAAALGTASRSQVSGEAAALRARRSSWHGGA